MSGIGNYPVLQLIISILISIVAILLIISSITIRKRFQNLDRIFSVTVFSIGLTILVFSIVNFMMESIVELKVG
mgnify:CR=1 FL=1